VNAEKPKDCPCCRSRNIGHYSDDDTFPPRVGITCLDCGIRTAPELDQAKALRVWNRRERKRRAEDWTRSNWPEGGRDL